MKPAVIMFWVALAAVDCPAGEPIRASLEAATNRPGWFVMHISNSSSNTIRFLDIPEGTGWCGEFYEVTVDKQGERHTSEGNTWYAPIGQPKVIEVAAGNSYDRDIQPGAYLLHTDVKPPCQITVTYRLSSKIKDLWKTKPTGADLDLTFWTQKLQIIEPEGAANGSQPIGSETNRTSSAAGSGR